MKRFLHKLSSIITFQKLNDFLNKFCNFLFTASHRRWHKPRDQVNKKTDSSGSEACYSCKVCGKSFKRQAYLNKHLATHNKKPVSDINMSLTHNESSAGSFVAHSGHSHDSGDVLIPQTVFSFNRTTSPTQSSDGSEHELVINENSNSSVNSMASTASAKFKLISTRFTEDESIAISALTNLRNGPSVIRHTLAV